MSSPQQQSDADKAAAEKAAADQGSRRYRVGGIVAYNVKDTITGDQLSGHALVLKVTGDQVDLAVIGHGHLQAHVDALAPAKAEDVHNPLPAPSEPATSGS